jgi:hypothetical protein
MYAIFHYCTSDGVVMAKRNVKYKPRFEYVNTDMVERRDGESSWFNIVPLGGRRKVEVEKCRECVTKYGTLSSVC